MFEILKRKLKTEDELIEEIHQSFLTEVDNILAEAKIIKSTESQYNGLLDKAKKLKELGFTQTKECITAETESKRIEAIMKENLDKEEISEAVEYFNQYYPNNKFITEQSVIKICNKYGLIYGPISIYTGTVPTKNMNEIANFKARQEDILMGHTTQEMNRSTWNYENKFNSISKSKYNDLKIQAEQEERRFDERFGSPISETYWQKRRLYNYCSSDYYHRNNLSKYKPAELEICAPSKDFNLEGYTIVKGVRIVKVEFKDPIVLHPVEYNGKKHYLIVTAWGKEASDELVVNQKFN